MIIVTMARKPVTDSVARTVLAHGTGGININASRIAMSQGDAEAIEKGNREIRHDRKPGISLQLSVNPMAVLPAVAHPNGRWPANLIFEHRPSCRRTGTMEVQGTPERPSETRPGGRSMTPQGEGERPNNPATSVVRYADESGREVIDAWVCASDCPVASLDAQSGVGQASTDDGRRGAGGIWHGSNGVPVGPRYGDIGTAARFFKQVGGQQCAKQTDTSASSAANPSSS